MKVHFNIRPANVNDAVAIATIGYNCWQDSYKNHIPADFLSSIDIAKQIERAETTIRQGGNILVGTDDTNTAVGYCAFGSSRDNLYTRENEIYSLYVALHVRSRGLGGILLFEAERNFIMPKPLVVRTLKHNARARSFFEENGFRYQAGRDGSYRNVAPDVAYVKK